MLFNFDVYSSLLLVFFVHILVYAFMICRRGIINQSTADKLLGTFLLLAALYVIPWMTGFAGWYSKQPYRDILFYTPFVNGLFIGPVLFLYVKAITNNNYRISKKDWLHFIPGVLYILWCVAVVLVDKLVVKRYYLMNGENDPDFDVWYQTVLKISIIIYLVLSVRYYEQYKKYVFFESSFTDVASMRWLNNFLIAFGLLTVLPLLLTAISFIPAIEKLNGYITSWYYFIAFAIVVYYIAINGYNASNIPLHRLHFEPQKLLQYQPVKLLQAQIAIEDAPFEIVNETAPKEDILLQSWKEKVTRIMTQQQLYTDTELTLTHLAKKLQTNTSVLSRIINQGFKLSFNDFVNNYRIHAVKEKLKAGEHEVQTLLGIAFDCGFNSKATFNRAFKKATGSSPKEWADKNYISS
jgi:AraC-like DNA-binding protein